jgi:hypothetical protein
MRVANAIGSWQVEAGFAADDWTGRPSGSQAILPVELSSFSSQCTSTTPVPSSQAAVNARVDGVVTEGVNKKVIDRWVMARLPQTRMGERAGDAVLAESKVWRLRLGVVALIPIQLQVTPKTPRQPP